MSDHLPECPWADRGFAFPCICDRLRACEQRVNDEWVRDYGGHRAFALGVQAAREAVERVSTLFEPLGPALAAIDALSENPDDLPVSENPNDAR